MIVFDNNTTGTVTGGGNDAPASGTVENWTVTTTTFPSSLTSGNTFHVADPSLPAEKVKVTAISGSGPYTWSTIRGDEGTTPVAHGINFTVNQVVTAGEFGEFLQVASPPSGADDYPVISAQWTEAMTAGVPFQFQQGKYLLSQPLPPVTVSSWKVTGAGKAESSSSGIGTYIQVASTASTSNWPQGTGIITFSSVTTCVLRDLSLDGNTVAFNELAMVHAEGTVRHLVENVSCQAKSIGPSIWNIGCEDCMLSKVEVAGSEANNGNQKLGVWYSCPGGTGWANGCDFFCPVAISTTNWLAMGNNAGTILWNNGKAATTNIAQIFGAWMFDASCFAGGHIYSPVDCIVGATDGTMSTSSNTLTSASALFTSDMAGNEIAVFQPGATAPLTGSVSTYISSTQVTTSFSNGSTALSNVFWFAQGGYIGSTAIRGARMVATSTPTWVNGKIPTWSGVTLDDQTDIATTAANTNTTMTLFNVNTGGGNSTFTRIGIGGIRFNTNKTSCTLFNGTPGSNHVNEIRGPVEAATTLTFLGQTLASPAPAVPGSTTAYTNYFPGPFDVTVAGGSVTGVAVNGTTLLTGDGTVTVPPAGTITLTYSVTPTWTWHQHF